MPAVLKAIYRALASYWLAILVLFFLLVLTFLGTVEQISHGLYATQQKFFTSLFVIQDVFGVPLLPLPGVYLLLVILFVNLLLGTTLRFRLQVSYMGVFIVHVGILFLLAGSLVTYRYSKDGHLTLYEGEKSNEMLSYYDWELAILPADASGQSTAFYIPSSDFKRTAAGGSLTFKNPALPFELTVSDYAPNAEIQSSGASDSAGPKIVNGKRLVSRELSPKQEQNIAGAYISVKELATGQVEDGIVSGFQRSPFRVTAGGKDWTIALQRRRWQLPFTVELDKFIRELYPGTQMPRSFASDVTVIEPSGRQKFHISMNKPLRYRGYTLFQASWDSDQNGRLISTFAVVKNPADQWPLYACVVIAVGLLVHFGYKLMRYLQLEARSAA